MSHLCEAGAISWFKTTSSEKYNPALKIDVDVQLIMNRTRHPSTVGIAEHCRLCIEERKEISGTRYK